MKKLDWTDCLASDSANPQLPADSFTFTTGNSFGLDGFGFEDGDNEGIENRHMDINLNQQPTHLPDGFTNTTAAVEENYQEVMSSDSMNLTDYLGLSEEDQKIGQALVDLDWLDPTQEPDLSRLPKALQWAVNGQDTPASAINLVPELEEAWSANTRNTGVYLIPAKENTVNTRTLKKSSADIKNAVAKASRALHKGYSLKQALEGVLEDLGEEADRAKPALAMLKEDEGLAGKVYVRASVFPGILDNKWEIKKFAKSARYVITDDQRIADKLSMQAVSEVPWKEALAHYLPQFELSGIKLASGSPREILKKAFKTTPIHEAKATVFPTHKLPEATEAEALAELAKYIPAAPLKPKDEKEQKKAEAYKKLDKLVDQGDLTAAEAAEIKSAKYTAEGMVKEASRKIYLKGAATKVYDGPLFGGFTGGEKPKVESSYSTEMVKQASTHGVSPKEILGVLKYARTEMNEGVAGKDLTEIIGATFTPNLRKAAAPFLKQIRAEHEGLAGFVYVDASAYGKDCDAGALRHRTNQIKLLKKQARCEGCLSRNEDSCMKYSKILIEGIKNASAVQQKNITAADAPDYVDIAAMFNSNKDFDVSNKEMKVEFSESAEKLSNILFGGMTVELNDE